MAIKSDRIASPQYDSGALDITANAATVVGSCTVASGVLLATAVGAAVAPVPTLGTVALGSGILAAGQWKELKEHFTGQPAVILTSNEDEFNEAVASQEAAAAA